MAPMAAVRWTLREESLMVLREVLASEGGRMKMFSSPMRLYRSFTQPEASSRVLRMTRCMPWVTVPDMAKALAEEKSPFVSIFLMSLFSRLSESFLRL